MINKNQNAIFQTYMHAKVGLVIVSIVAMSVASSTFAWSNDMTIAANIAEFVNSPTATPIASLSLKEKIQKFWNMLVGGGNFSKNPIREESEARQANIIYTRRQKKYFNDIADSKYTKDINTLASIRIIKGYDHKFYPQNDVRLSDFVYTLSRAYIYTTAGNPNLVDIQTLRDTAITNQRLVGLQTTNKTHILTADDVQIILKNFIQQHKDIVASELVFPANDTTINKEQIAHMIVTLLALQADDKVQGDYFTDIVNDPAQQAINTLARYDIVENDSTFYPQNYVRRNDFIIMLTKTLATIQNKEIAFATSDIADISPLNSIQSLYAWAEDHKILDYMLITTKGQNTIDPDAFVTKDEVYQTLKNITNVKIIIDTNTQDQKITRSELADLIVDVFNLSEDTSSDTDESKTLTQAVRIPLTKLFVSKL